MTILKLANLLHRIGKAKFYYQKGAKMTKITPLPKPPTTQDSLNFDIRADEFLESLPKFAEELNAFEANINNVGTEVDNKLSEAIIRGKEAIKSATNEGINSINSAADKRKKELLAIAAIKSDSWQNIAQFILLLIRKIRAKQQKELEKRGCILEYKVFFRNALPKGYKKAGSTLLAKDYPLAWFYSRQTNPLLQQNTPPKSFLLPKGNLYIKGTDNKAHVGSFGEQQLLEHTHNYYITNLANTGDRIKGGSDHHRNFSSHLSHSSVATSNVGKKTNEVKRIHLLEGYFVGE